MPYDGRRFNFAPYNFFQRPDDRYNIGGFAHHTVNEHLNIYGSAMYMDNHTRSAVAPSGLFGVQAQISCSNPLLSDQQRQFLCGDVGLGPDDFASVGVLKRTVEAGPRLDDLRHADNRINLGVDGDIIDGVHYDVSAQRGEVVFNVAHLNYINTGHAQQALAAIDDGNGNAVCGADADAGCVPLDLFGGPITPAQLGFSTVSGQEQASQIERIVTTALTVDLGRFGAHFPTAQSGVAFAVGTEYRGESLEYNPDALVQVGNLGGFGGPRPSVAGHFQVHEIFTEVRVPVVEDMPGATLLQFDGAYRHAKYSSAGSANSYKAGMQYAPVHDATLRASYQRAVRAPSVTELFSPSALGLYGGADPCSGPALEDNPDRPSLEGCLATGATEAQYNAGVNGSPGAIQDCLAGQCNGFFGGNPLLDVETSTTRSFGIAFTPTFVKNLTGTIDYFDINVENAIGVLPPNTALTQCTATLDPFYCDRIHRGPGGRLWGDPSTPGVGFVNGPNENLGFFRTKGVDTEVSYKMAFGDVGRLSIGYVATYLIDYKFENAPGLGIYDCAGFYGTTCGVPNPRYRHKLRGTWDFPMGLAVSLNWRYFGDAHLDTNNSDPNLNDGDGSIDQIDDKLEAKNYLDLSGAYALPEITNMVKATLRFGVNNIGNTKPQAVSSNDPNPVSAPPFGNGNTFPNVYDPLGPLFFVGVQADF